MGLNLTGLGLEGSLPVALARLASLSSLDLSHNRFRGSIPPDWLESGAFPALAVARLGHNLLGGGEWAVQGSWPAFCCAGQDTCMAHA